MTTNKSTMETTVQSCSDCLKSFAANLNILLCHSFIAWQQSRLYSQADTWN
jgi:hypothetical protein